MILKLAAAAADRSYVQRLMRALEEYDNLRLSVFTDQESLKLSLADRKYDVLLFDPAFYDPQAFQNAVTLPVLLLDENYILPEYLKDFAKISRYQRVSQIYKRVLELYSEKAGSAGNLSETGRAGAAAFYSPAGGTGKTTLALACAARLAAQGVRVCYLNFEEAASEECYLPQKAERGLSELLGCLGENLNFSMKLQGLLQNKGENLYYLNHFDSPNDFYEMKEEELEKLMEVIQGSGFFDAAVMDLGCSMERKNQKLFELADTIVLVEGCGRTAESKQKIFYNQMHILNAYREKMVRVINFDTGEKPSQESEIPVIGRIKRMAESDTALLADALAQGPYLKAVADAVYGKERA